MVLSEEAQSIRDGIGEFLNELAFVDRRWIRIDSCSNKTFHQPASTGGSGETKEVDFPLESFSDLLGVSAKKANEYLCAAKLMQPHSLHKTLGLNRKGWDALISEFHLDMQLEQISDIHYLGNRIHVMRIGCLDESDDNPKPFNAKDQAKRFFDTGWKPKNLDVTSQAKEFLSKTALDLTIIMAKQQKELDEKERKREGEADEPVSSTTSNGKSEECVPCKPPAKSQSIMVDMKDAQVKPIVWTSPNGKTQVAVRVPRSGTRISFRETARQTGWIEQVTETMLDKGKVLPEVGVEWLFEAMLERYQPQFESFCERKGFKRTSKDAKMPARKKVKTRR